MLTFLLYSFGIVSKIHYIMDRKRIEKIATVSLAKCDQNETHFFGSLTATWQFKRSSNFEIVGCRKSLMLSRSLCWYTFFFLHFLKIRLLIYILSFCILQSDWVSLWILLFCIFFFGIFDSFRKNVWMCKTYPAATLTTIHRFFS